MTAMAKPAACTTSRRGQRGLSMIDLMIGLVVGLIASLVVFQAFANFEGQKRTTVSGNDAQGNGLLTLATIESEMRSAGNGVAFSALIGNGGCGRLLWYNGTAKAPLPLLPVRIVDGGASGGSDTIDTMYASTAFGTNAGELSVGMASNSADFNLKRAAGLAVGDMVIAAQAGRDCTLHQLTAIDPLTLVARHESTSAFNPDNATIGGLVPAWPTYGPNTRLYNVGRLVARRYAVGAATQLEETDLIAGTAALPRFDQIASIQAQYGIAPAGSTSVNCWVNATTGNACDGGDWSAPTAAMTARILAVRIAVVARSGTLEKVNVTNPCSVTQPDGPCTWAAIGGETPPAVDLSADTDWRRYRYRVYTTVVPLRNVIWAGL